MALQSIQTRLCKCVQPNTILAALVLAHLLFSPAALLADNLDEELIRQAPKIVRHIRAHGYKNVGVLAFRLKHGDPKPTFGASLLNENIASRVENALVLALNPEAEPIGIVRNASEVASRSIEGVSYRTAESRSRLFDVQYPLAWGRGTVLADAFVSGKITLSQDLKETTVDVEIFDRNEYRKVLDFIVKTDRFILADAGQGFSLSKGKGLFARGASDDDIIEGVKAETTITSSQSSSTGAVSGSAAFPVQLSVFYNGKLQAPQRDGTAGPYNLKLQDPKPGERVTFGLKNTLGEPVGVALTVNGISTLYEEINQPDKLTRWVLEPNKDYQLQGFYKKDGKSYEEISGLPEEISQQKYEDFGGEGIAGVIHLYVFRKAPDAALAAAATPKFSRSMRRLSPEQVNSGPPAGPFELQALIARNANAATGRGLMAWSNKKGETDLKSADLGPVVLTDTMVLKYYEKQQAR